MTLLHVHDMATATLPVGYEMRTVTVDDAQGIYDLQAVISMKIVGCVDETLRDITDELNNPDTNLAHDQRVICDATGRIVGYAVIYEQGRIQAPFVDLYVYPDEYETQPPLFDVLWSWLMTRANENLALVAPELRVVVSAYSYSTDDWYNARLNSTGASVVRHSYQMGIDFNEPPEAPELPTGFTLRYATRDEDWAPILMAIRDAWRDHFGYVETPFEEHVARWTNDWKPKFNDDLWLLGMAGDEIVGVSLCSDDATDDPAEGYIGTLCVRRTYRRRGLAGYLLRQSFVALYEKGKTKVILGVDAGSLTGAVRLYESAGMTVRTRYDLFELELRPGVETRTVTL